MLFVGFLRAIVLEGYCAGHAIEVGESVVMESEGSDVDVDESCLDYDHDDGYCYYEYFAAFVVELLLVLLQRQLAVGCVVFVVVVVAVESQKFLGIC